MGKKIKKGKLALLALAGSAFVASLLYDKKQQKKNELDSLEVNFEEVSQEN
ncbi:hypothetical protein [Clostridium sp.]|uniref:hypothetical protein n=1 Tax=Clostridium sp. TaxID=1506 RepID=UPI00260D1E21|nr:hypothetical protein [Clostridium sp.]